MLVVYSLPCAFSSLMLTSYRSLWKLGGLSLISNMLISTPNFVSSDKSVLLASNLSYRINVSPVSQLFMVDKSNFRAEQICKCLMSLSTEMCVWSNLEDFLLLVVHSLVDRHSASCSIDGKDSLWLLIHSFAIEFKINTVLPLDINLQYNITWILYAAFGGVRCAFII